MGCSESVEAVAQSFRAENAATKVKPVAADIADYKLVQSFFESLRGSEYADLPRATVSLQSVTAIASLVLKPSIANPPQRSGSCQQRGDNT